MRPALLLGLLPLVFSASASADEPPWAPGGRVIARLSAEPDSAFVEQPVSVTLRIGVDLRFFREYGVPLFRRAMDLPLKVNATWLTGLPGAEIRAPGGGPATDGTEARSFALNDRVVSLAPSGEGGYDGRSLTVFRIERTVIPERPGELRLPAPTVRFAWATRFEEDFVNGRVPLDRRETEVEGPPLVVPVRPLPAAGRPADFSGAVGRFRVEARAAPREVKVGESIRVTLEIRGQGNLARFPGLPPPELPGFHLYGSVDDRETPVRSVVLDLTPTAAEVTAIPSLSLSYFDPGPPAGYRSARTEPIPIRVHPAPGVAPPPAAEKPDGPVALILAAALAVLAGAGFVILRRRAAARARPDPAAEQALAAQAAFRAEAESPDADPAAVLAAFLSVHLGCAPAAVISPDLADRLAAAGVPRSLAECTALRLEEWVGSRYGGESGGDEPRFAARDLREQLARAFEES